MMNTFASILFLVVFAQASKKKSEKLSQKMLRSELLGDCSYDNCAKQKSCDACTALQCFAGGNCGWCEERGGGLPQCMEYARLGAGRDANCPWVIEGWNFDGKGIHGTEGQEQCKKIPGMQTRDKERKAVSAAADLQMKTFFDSQKNKGALEQFTGQEFTVPQFLTDGLKVGTKLLSKNSFEAVSEEFAKDEGEFGACLATLKKEKSDFTFTKMHTCMAAVGINALLKIAGGAPGLFNSAEDEDEDEDEWTEKDDFMDCVAQMLFLYSADMRISSQGLAESCASTVKKVHSHIFDVIEDNVREIDSLRSTGFKQLAELNFNPVTELEKLTKLLKKLEGARYS